MPSNNILHPVELNNHEIFNYEFKKIDSISNIKHKNKNFLHEESSSSSLEIDKEVVKEIHQSETLNSSVSSIPSEDMEQISKFNTNMMDKIDKLQQKLQDVQENISNSDSSPSNTQEIQKSYQDGFNAGKKEATEESSSQNNDVKQSFNQSINSITSYIDKANTTISSLEKELVRASIDIAQEIMQVQIEEKSSLVATQIAKKLLLDLSEATQITLKVSVFDYDHITQNIQDDRITIQKDLAIAKGGVMILSDVTNIDGTIKERFLKIKSAFYEDH